MKRREILLAGSTLAPRSATASPHISRTASALMLRFVPTGELTTLDPFRTEALTVRNHASMVYEQLYSLDGAHRAHPEAVEGHVVEDDGRRWTFTLRRGRKFHDGEPVRARDVVASIRRWASLDRLAGEHLLSLAEEIAPIDDRRFRIRLRRPFPSLPETFARITAPCLFILPERVAGAHAPAEIADATGSGPFRFVAREWERGRRAVYERNQGWTSARRHMRDDSDTRTSYFSRVEWHFIADAAAAAAALHTGAVDWWEQVPVDLAPVLARNRHLAVDISKPYGSIGCFQPNHTTTPFDNPGARRAVMKALNQSMAMRAVTGNNSRLYRNTVGFFAPASPFAFDIGPEWLNGNLDDARRALETAGAAGAKLRLLHATDIPAVHGMSLYCTDLLRKLGFDVDIVADTWFRAVIQRRQSREPLNRDGWSAFVTVSPGENHLTPVTNRLLRSGARAWFGWPDVPQLETLREEWFGARSEEEASTVARAIQRAAFLSVPYVPMGQYFLPTAYRRDLASMLNGTTIFRNMWAR